MVYPIIGSVLNIGVINFVCLLNNLITSIQLFFDSQLSKYYQRRVIKYTLTEKDWMNRQLPP